MQRGDFDKSKKIKISEEMHMTEATVFPIKKLTANIKLLAWNYKL